MGPATVAAVVTAVISAVATVLAAWVQGRAQRLPGYSAQEPGRAGEPVSGAGTSVVTCHEIRPDERR